MDCMLTSLKDPESAVRAAEQLQLLAENEKPEGAYAPAVCRCLGAVLLSSLSSDIQQHRLTTAVLQTLLAWCRMADGRAGAARNLPIDQAVRWLQAPDILCELLTTQLLQLLEGLAADGHGRSCLYQAGAVPVLTRLLVAVAESHQRPPARFVASHAAFHSITANRAASGNGSTSQPETTRAWQRLGELLVGCLSNLLLPLGSPDVLLQQTLFVEGSGVDAAAQILVQQGIARSVAGTHMGDAALSLTAYPDSSSSSSKNNNGRTLVARLCMLLTMLSQQEEWERPVHQALAAAAATAFQRWGYSLGGGLELAPNKPAREEVKSTTGMVAQPLLGSVGMPLSGSLLAEVLMFGQSNA